MKTIIYIILIILFLLGCASCSAANKEDKDNNSITDTEAENKDDSKQVIITPEFNPDRKIVKYKNLPYFGYKEGFEYFDEYRWQSLAENFEEEEKLNTDEKGRTIYDNIHIDNKYVYDDGDAGLCLDYNEIARDYLDNYEKATRRRGDYIISDFKDGVCIHEYIYKKSNAKKNKLIVDIPDKIDGKKVLKLGTASKRLWENEISVDDEYIQTGFLINVPSKVKVTVKIPETVRDISESSFKNILSDDFYEYYSADPEYNNDAVKYESTYISEFIVDKSNPYYTSDKGSLYTKDRKWLLFVRGNLKDFVAPDSVRTISEEAFDNYSTEDDITITIGENVKKIYDILPTGFSDESKLKYRLKKGSYADKFIHNDWDKKYDNHIEYM